MGYGEGDIKPSVLSRPVFFVVLRGLEVAECKDLGFYAEDLTAGIFYVQEPEPT